MLQLRQRLQVLPPGRESAPIKVQACQLGAAGQGCWDSRQLAVKDGEMAQLRQSLQNLLQLAAVAELGLAEEPQLSQRCEQCQHSRRCPLFNCIAPDGHDMPSGQGSQVFLHQQRLARKAVCNQRCMGKAREEDVHDGESGQIRRECAGGFQLAAAAYNVLASLQPCNPPGAVSLPTEPRTLPLLNPLLQFSQPAAVAGPHSHHGASEPAATSGAQCRAGRRQAGPAWGDRCIAVGKYQ